MTDKTAANTILAQLGGNRFIAMTGAKYFTCDDKSLSFQFPNRSSTNCCRITLNSMDTYDMDFKRVYGIKVTPVKTYEGIYDTMLQDIFTEQTGLCLSLGRIGQ